MNMKVGDKVVVNKDIYRIEGFYAGKGENGYIIDIFHNAMCRYKRVISAKVLMENGCIKTFRLTSLNVVK